MPDYAFIQEPSELASTSHHDSLNTIIVQEQAATNTSSSILPKLQQGSRNLNPVDESYEISESNFCAEEHRI